MLFKKLVSVFIFFFGAPLYAETLGFSVSDQPIGVDVLDEKLMTPVSGATIKLEKTSPGANTQTLTVSKTGYATFTLIGVTQQHITVYLKQIAQALPEVIASGTLSGFPSRSSSKVVQAGLVFRTIDAFDLLHFETESLISPLRDTIDVFGPRRIPSNLVLPEQDVSYFLATFRLDKPEYRLPLIAGKPTRLAAVQGEIDVRDLLPAIQGGGFSLAMLNDFRFKRIGTSQTFMPRDDLRHDLEGTLDLRERYRVTPERPPFEGDVLVVAVTDLDSDRKNLLPTDVKVAFNSQDSSSVRTVRLNSTTEATGGSQHVVTLAVNRPNKVLSGILTPNAGPTLRPGAFLSVNELPQDGRLAETIALSAPQTGLAAAVFETEVPSSSGSAKLVPVHYVYVLPAAGAVQLITRDVSQADRLKRYSVLSLDFGAGFDERRVDGATQMQRVLRFTQAYSDVR